MKKAMIALAAMAVTGTAVAGPSWTYADFGYNRSTSGSEDTDGYSIRGSLGFADIWHVGASWIDGEVAGGKGSGGADTDGYELTVGVHPAVSDTTDLVFEISYADADVDTASVSGSGDGYALTSGLRSMWTENLEINAAVSVVDASVDGCSSCDSTSIVVGAGGQYLFTDNVGVGVDVANGGTGGNTANFYVRWNF